MKTKQKYAKWQIGSVIETLLEQSRWFKILPLPFDVFEVTVKDERPLPEAKAPIDTGKIVGLATWLKEVESDFDEGLTPEALKEFSDYFYRGLAPSEAIRQYRQDEEAESERHIDILQHRIGWWLREEDAPEELDDCSKEHIEQCIKEGYNQGELCVLGNDGNTGYRGWWRIAPAN